MMQFQIQREHFNALRVAAAMNDVRYYLAGFHVHKNGEWWAESTDGHRLLRVPLTRIDDGPDPSDTGRMIYSLADATRKFSKRSGETITIDVPNLDDALTVEGDAVSRGARVTGTDGRVQVCPLIDGKFPDTDKVMPAGPADGASVSCIAVNAQYLADVPKALEAHGMVAVRPSGTETAEGAPTGPLWVDIHDADDVRYIVMPCRV